MRNRGFGADPGCLLNLYNKLNKEHPHELLPLETELAEELQYRSRDEFRIVMTMTLAPGTADLNLSKALGKLFKLHPNFQSLRPLSEEPEEIREFLRDCGFGLNNPHRGGNGGRLLTLLFLYFNEWNRKITYHNIEDLEQHPNCRGFSSHSIRTLKAYHFGDRDVLPLDNPAFESLKEYLHPYSNCDIDYVRDDIENKLAGEKDISLIDFHELLRFSGQAKKKYAIEKIIVGWNAWRLLCSDERRKLNYNWIFRNLVKNEAIATKLWRFFCEIMDC